MMNQTIALTVNGESHVLETTARTQLAELLRDELGLTGTHLGCEQGVCGACTVMIGGKPVRSCITFAGACDGADIQTVEGFREDDIMDRLRTAFSKHHALQCGFCTPGMIVTARDIVSRFAEPDDAKIRHELSGNLCRCTGYVGIVAAIRDVIMQRNELGLKPTEPMTPLLGSGGGFEPFEPVTTELAKPAARSATSTGNISVDGEWTMVERTFELHHPSSKVWCHFRDLKTVSACIPGALVDEVGENTFSGHVEVRFGPIRAKFVGNGHFENDETDRSGSIEGQGNDKGGQSNVRGQLHYQIAEGEAPDTTTVDVNFRFQIQGMLAQFNRAELVAGLVDFILGQFVSNCDAMLCGREVQPGKRLSAVGVAATIVRSWFRSQFGKER